MNKKVDFALGYFEAKILKNKTNHENIRKYLADRELLPGKKVRSAESINRIIYDKIKSGEPFLAGRFGATELFAIRTFDFGITSRYEKALTQMEMWSGFFPANEKYIRQFVDLMIEYIPYADVMGVWMLPFEKYYLKKYGSSGLELTYLLDLEPWSAPNFPWSAALKGKKVLVIHPFEESIQEQFLKKEKLFVGTDILPKFELKTLKAVQTIAGEKDKRFSNWFEALDWMYNEALKVDFEIAIIGCGAYGFPLAAKLKQAGKQAIHLAGATQLLFGIRGKRWEESEDFAYVQKFFNGEWVYPSENDKPKLASKVEGGCYW